MRKGGAHAVTPLRSAPTARGGRRDWSLPSHPPAPTPPASTVRDPFARPWYRGRPQLVESATSSAEGTSRRTLAVHCFGRAENVRKSSARLKADRQRESRLRRECRSD